MFITLVQSAFTTATSAVTIDLVW